MEDKYYDGTNAFGVSKEIHYKKSSVYELLIDNWTGFVNDNTQFGLLDFYFKVNPIIAKKIKENDLYPFQSNYNLGFLYIGKVKPPHTSKGSYTTKPSITFPIESEEEINYINFDLNEIWIYNHITGEIYKKIKQQNGLKHNVKYSLGNCNLISELPDLDLLKFREEGTITFNVCVFASQNNKILIKGISESTTIKDLSQQLEAKKIIDELKFKSKNLDDVTNGTITLPFTKN